MRRSDFADLNAFAAIAEHLSFRAAALRLGVTPSALSHTMRQLEARVGVRLLNRSTRSVSLTDAGSRLLARLRPAIDQIDGALEDLNLERRRPFGRLRIYATHLSAMAVVAPVWRRFLSAYPDIDLELEVGDASIDIVSRGFDAGIGPQDRAAGEMVTVRVAGPMKAAVVAAPSYLAGRRTPRAPDDLAHHDCIRYRRGADGVVLEWPFERDGERRRISVSGPIMVNAGDMAVRAAVDGLGVAFAAHAYAAPYLRSGQLVRVLEDWSPTYEGLFIYYPSQPQTSAALRAFIEAVTLAGDGHSAESAADTGVTVDIPN